MPAQALTQAVSGVGNIVPSGIQCSIQNSAADSLGGGFIVVIVVHGQKPGGGFATISSVRDIANGFYTALTNITDAAGTIRHSLFYFQCSAHSFQYQNTITATFSTPTTNMYMRFCEFKAVLLGGNPINVNNSATGAGTNPATPSVTPTVSNDLMFSCATIIGPPLVGAGSGWSLAGLDSVGNVDEYILNAGTTSYAGTFAAGGTPPTTWLATVVGFKNQIGQAYPQILGLTPQSSMGLSAGLKAAASDSLVIGGSIITSGKVTHGAHVKI